MLRQSAKFQESAQLGREWIILCPGPSLAQYREFSGDPRLTIAVNSAIIRMKAGYWAMLDMEVFQAVNKKEDLRRWRETTTLWIPRVWEDHIKRFSDLEQAMFYCFDRETWGNLTFEMGGPWHGWPWREYSFFTALALAIKKGAKKITIYGADIRGTGYFAEGFENSRTRHLIKRWKDEKHWFEQIVQLCKNEGIEVIREEVRSD